MQPWFNDRASRPQARRPRRTRPGRPGVWPWPAPSTALVVSARRRSSRRWAARRRPRAGTSPPLRARARTTSCWGRHAPTRSSASASGSPSRTSIPTGRSPRSSRPGTARPGRWLPQPPLPPGHGGGLFAVSCVTGSDCWAVGAIVGVSGNGGPSGTLIENWNGSAWSVVPSPTPTGPGVGGCAPAGRELHVGVQLLRRRVLDGPERQRSQRRDRAVERRGMEHRPRRRHRPDLRWALHRAVPRRRRLLGGGQRRSRAAEPQLPPHLPGRGR